MTHHTMSGHGATFCCFKLRGSTMRVMLEHKHQPYVGQIYKLDVLYFDIKTKITLNNIK